MGTTPNYNVPYPESTDFVAQGAAAIQAVADGFDTVVGDLATKTEAITTKGDLIVGDASGDADRLPIGTDGQILVADSGETLGAKWDTVPTPAAGLELLGTVSTGSGVAAMSLNSVFSGTYDDYLIL